MHEHSTAGSDQSAVGAINRTLHQDRLPIVGGRGTPGEVSGQQLEQLSDEEFWRYARKLAGHLPAPQAGLPVPRQGWQDLPLQVPALEQPAGRAQDPPLLVCKLSRGYCLVPLTTLFEVVRPPQGIYQPPRLVCQSPDRDGETCPYTLLPAVPQWMVGLTVWHGETIAVIDLDAYLTDHTAAWQNTGGWQGQAAGLPQDLPLQGMLLIADYAGLPFGLLVSGIGQNIPDGVDQSAGGPINRPLGTIAVNTADEVDQSTGGAINQAPTWYLPSRAAFIKGIQDGALVLDIPLLLADVMQEIETAASDG